MAKQPKDSQNSPATSAKGGGGAEKPPGRFKQIGLVAKLVHRQSPKSIPLAVGVSVLVLALAVLGGFLTGSWLYWILLGIPVAFIAGFLLFTRSAQRIQYQMLDGQLGAGMAVLENMRGDWSVDPGVNGNRSMDIVHRAVGRPGVVLVGEGDPQRLKGLIAAEKKRVARVAYHTPIYDVQVGRGEGQVPIADLQKRMLKLPRNLGKAEVAELRYRLKALPPAMQMPKGPIPKGVKMPKGPKQGR
ncbi:DUF4191 domain-containing protein [Marinitenerispora sediminis]|uniref:DUF4191 domain-containing protein n=1 Tax=Marinitenerispora sediminis TaxID=1931232 RepID=A0A368SZX5_9ACTN|nr:DUF4191 domain-containing protein [Marinitenerispora sediminis]RCV51629.1 DUF4191 domain-containing protein [Marinitenerispora sediminis]RCV54115.1 DUF4191 domain-containing protein [Marinitenerispora sediminis]RCV54356.1 DUF4191 domain-containing protein [Marinitenerispora sediminis]